jgi:transposase-like protein
VIRYVPEFEKRWNRFARPVNTSWRVNETYINIRGKWSYLYRAVDRHGKTVDFLLRPDRGIAAAQAFFRKALSTNLPRWPRKITLDGHLQSHLVLRECGHYLGRYRTCPSDPQETILVRARSISELRVARANLGSSTRVALGASPRMCRRDPDSHPEPKFERLQCTSS